jgi:diaminohydroxyphosphoribosylaminopyrimidine deaminase/5-amino-6-(5-phosphoribosylamino)uracil reductase
MNDHTIYMQRCLELAEIASGKVAPNPLVGAVVVHNNKIIGEGFHELYGQAHAEVNAISHAIASGHGDLLSESTLYVNLEPCNHHGKTPPCSELIIHHHIPKVIVGCRDPFNEVNGKGIETLRNAGVDVTTGVLEETCRQLNHRFITYHEKKRPYIILKFAQTSDGYISPLTGSGKISNEYSDMLVHRWRSEEQAILVGKRTVQKDNPLLTVRNWKGNNPLRVVIDKHLQVSTESNVFNRDAQTLVINQDKSGFEGNIEYVTAKYIDLPKEIGQILYERNILSVIVEGGTNILDQFINANYWDEARIIRSPKLFGSGLKAPEVPGAVVGKQKLAGDEIVYLVPRH